MIRLNVRYLVFSSDYRKVQIWAGYCVEATTLFILVGTEEVTVRVVESFNISMCVCVVTFFF